MRIISFVVLMFAVVVGIGCKGIQGNPAAPSLAVQEMVVKTTPPPTPEPVPVGYPMLRCSPDGAATVAGWPATFTARGGDGGYYWSAPDGTPSAGSGQSFTTTFTPGTRWVSVTSGGQSATCEIGVATPPPQ